ncbi:MULTISPECIES: hypothetical protein [unclassified Methylobacterium]|jgi:hypothetical protein|uniref:hypothetical protein n=1 Tax=unclassified Methylobacterium TaxID=2615210 RepID=UPI0006FEDB77|nr:MULTISPECIES: hypothetical protein [unclassified Methylobacterium]KQO66730.1 hypothetical protein ASF18_08275 [Methylobacterium sp. Leaf89]KQO77822.1 hypothetical protein ASF20_12625 [Methylobacterium sp. Leaf88]KQP62578.1 hypothetical protein ASF41_08215 [Methylobacterium sp. Leaf111]KQT76733.1 hypothetical protein ASG51_07740 [Methylobacterium sp. Leaf465]KQU33271.1 hypothetical protein ASG63_15380 [Methylobacterium sp. Leaf94]
MRSVSIALMGALTLAAVGANTAAEAQGRYAPAGYRVSQPLPIRIRPRSWLDAGNVVEANNGSVSNPATNPQFITASYLNSPPYGRNDRFGGGILSDPITNGPFVGARSSAIRNVDLSAIDAIDPTSYVSRFGNPY